MSPFFLPLRPEDRMNRDGRNGLRSISVHVPVVMSSAITFPDIGAQRIPQQL